jgi:hypothetical protein
MKKHTTKLIMSKASMYLTNNCFPFTAQYWEHQAEVFSGFTGCVAERGLYPCASDATDISREDGAFYASSAVIWDPEQDVCVETGNTIEDQLFIIRGGNPMNKHELVKRTGVSTSIHFQSIVASYAAGCVLTLFTVS